MIAGKRLAVGIALTLCLGLLTGCWDRKEMDDLALVMASGLDLAEDGQIESTLQIALPTGIPGAITSGGKTAKPVLVISGKGKDGMDSLNRLQQQLSRQISLGHRGVIVIGEQYARKGIDQVLDTLLRSPESRYNSYIVTTCGTTAKEVLNAPYMLEHIPSIGINKIQSGDFSYSVKVDKFLDAFSANGRSPVTGAIRLVKDSSNKPSYLIDKVAIYHQNKLVGFLSGQETKAFRLLVGKIDGMKLSSQVDPPTPREKGTVNLAMMKAKTKIHTEIKQGKPEITVNFLAEASVAANDTTMDLSNIANLARVEKKFADDLQKLFLKTISHTQKEFNADIFGFGGEIHIQHPYLWKEMKKNWMAIYPEVPVHVNTKVEIIRIGRTQAPAHQQME